MEGILIAHGAGLLLAAIAAAWDFRTGHIPNWLTLPPLVIAPLVYGLMNGISGAYGTLGFLESVFGIVACGAVPFFMFRMKGQPMHGGDVKVFAALGAILGPFIGIEAQLLAVIVAAIYALGRLAWHGKLFRTLGNAFYVLLNPILPKKRRREISPEMLHKIRLGVPIFIGTALALADRHQLLLMM